jgi:hypothetical protein
MGCCDTRDYTRDARRCAKVSGPETKKSTLPMTTCSRKRL